MGTLYSAAQVFRNCSKPCPIFYNQVEGFKLFKGWHNQDLNHRQYYQVSAVKRWAQTALWSLRYDNFSRSDLTKKYHVFMLWRERDIVFLFFLTYFVNNSIELSNFWNSSVRVLIVGILYVIIKAEYGLKPLISDCRFLTIMYFYFLNLFC